MIENLEDILIRHFQFTSFKQGQKDVISSVLSGHNTVAVLPTGTGKSLCYQLPAYIMTGTVVIVSPLLSLMQDQVEQIRIRGEKRVVALNSFLNREEKMEILNHLEHYKFIFISPEMLNIDGIQKRLQRLEISLFVVDEAHCISQWGYDFRPDYMKLGVIREALGNPLTLALTATATRNVVKDMVDSLKLEEWKEFIHSVDRPNISMKVEELEDLDEKDNRLIELVSHLQGPGIIYFSSKKKAEATVMRLKALGMSNCMAYHGGMNQESRILVQQQFVYGQLDVICATSAFGMGINKENIRYIIHYHMPLQLESYLQEIGRAGRDGKRSVAILLYTRGDEKLLHHLIESELPNDLQMDRMTQWLTENTGASIEEHEETLRAVAGLNDTQWRITSDFFRSMATDNVKVEEGISNFKQFIDERINFKIMQIEHMKKWVKSLQCRRDKILEYFSEEKKKESIEDCCDVCGLDLKAFQKEEQAEVIKRIPFNWRNYLSAILLKE